MYSKSAYITIILTVSITIILVMREGPWTNTLGQLDWLATSGILLWVLSPYILLSVLARRASDSDVSGLIVLIGTLLIAAGGVLLLTAANSAISVEHPRMHLIYLPLFQWAALGLLAFVQEIMIKRAGR